MHKIKHNNRNKVMALLAFLFFFFFTTILIPSLFLNYLSFSGIGHFFSKNIIYGYASAVILLYFLIVGEYYYNINIDAYVIQITSYRPIVDFFKQKDYIDIPHSMLTSYAFFNRPLSLNKTLVMKIETNSGKKMTKRFNLTLITKREVEIISAILNKIIAKNN